MSEPNQPDEPFLEGDADLDKILLDLDTASRELPVEAIRAARRHRDAMVPKLVEVLQEASVEANPGKTRRGCSFLCTFSADGVPGERGLPAILEAVSLPGELPFDLFGDAITSVLARVLAALAGNRLEVLDQLIRDRD